MVVSFEEVGFTFQPGLSAVLADDDPQSTQESRDGHDVGDGANRSGRRHLG